MNITFECADKVNGLMTITVEKADYEEKVNKTLKDYRKKAQVPGFRPGMVPMGLVKRQYGTAIKVDEVLAFPDDGLLFLGPGCIPVASVCDHNDIRSVRRHQKRRGCAKAFVIRVRRDHCDPVLFAECNGLYHVLFPFCSRRIIEFFRRPVLSRAPKLA